jgi:hypothetical protein
MIKPNYHLTQKQQREAYHKMRACQSVTILTVSVSAAVALWFAVEVVTWFIR